MTTCKNCGTEFDSNFCPNCGQKATAGERLNLKAFFKNATTSFARFNGGFIATAIGLVKHPWKVISDYIHGRRADYSPPFTMLIQVILYATVLVDILQSLTGIDLHFNDTPFLSLDVGHWFVDFVLSSDVFQNIVLIIPASLAGMIAFRWVGGRRYNAAEYLVAGTYMMCLYFILQFLVIPVQLILRGDHYGIAQIAIVVYILVTLWKAFPVKRWWVRVLSILLYLVVALVLIVVELALIGVMALPFVSNDGISIGFNIA